MPMVCQYMESSKGTCPTQEVCARLKFVKVFPKSLANILEHIIRIVTITYLRADIGIKSPLLPGKQGEKLFGYRELWHHPSPGGKKRELYKYMSGSLFILESYRAGHKERTIFDRIIFDSQIRGGRA